MKLAEQLHCPPHPSWEDEVVLEALVKMDLRGVCGGCLDGTEVCVGFLSSPPPPRVCVFKREMLQRFLSSRGRRKKGWFEERQRAWQVF